MQGFALPPFSSAWEKACVRDFAGALIPLKSPEINPVDFKVCFFGSGSGCGGSAAGSPLAAPVRGPSHWKGRVFLRLDKWLKVSRLIKRRTVANEACDNGRVTANGRPFKASYEVKPGDVLELKFGEKLIRVEVLSTADIVGKADASAMYQELR